MTTKEQPRTNADRNFFCEDSPTRAHHWVLGAPGTTMTGKCKHCRAEREFNPFEQAVRFN